MLFLDFLKQVNGGGERDRTAGLDVANVALSQLSYTPDETVESIAAVFICCRIP